MALLICWVGTRIKADAGCSIIKYQEEGLAELQVPLLHRVFEILLTKIMIIFFKADAGNTT